MELRFGVVAADSQPQHILQTQPNTFSVARVLLYHEASTSWAEAAENISEKKNLK